MISIKLIQKAILILAVLATTFSFQMVFLATHGVQDNELSSNDNNLFTSDGVPQYIDSVTISYGSEGSGSLSYTYIDNGNYKQYNAEWIGNPFLEYILDLDLNFDPALEGGDYYLSVHIASTAANDVYLWVNGEVFDHSTNLDFDMQRIDNVNSISLGGSNMDNGYSFLIYYVQLIPIGSAPDTWYESNEDYNVGDFPVNEWNFDASSDITIATAASLGTDMRGNVIKITGDLGGSMSRYGTFDITSDEALFLSFKAQLNAQYGWAKGIVELAALTQDFLTIEFDSDTDDPQYYTINFYLADNSLAQFYDFLVGQVYDIDIFIQRDPITSLVKYWIFINQELLTVKEVSTTLVPVATIAKINAPGYSIDFVIDEFFLGYTPFTLYPVELREMAIPIYYLYAPTHLTTNSYVDDIYLYYEYFDTYQSTTTYGVFLGPTFGLDMTFDIPFSEVVNLGPVNKYEVGASDTDIIIYHYFEANIEDILFTLPGDDPDVVTDTILGWYTFDYTHYSVEGDTINIFNQTFGELPEEYYDCFQQKQKIGTESYLADGGNQLQPYLIEARSLETSNNAGGAIGIGVDYMGQGFSIGINFDWYYSAVVEAEVSLLVEWTNNPPDPDTQKVTIDCDLYAPPEGSYSTELELPPYFVDQIGETISSTKVIELRAVGGLARIDLTWDANIEPDLDHYNVYRNDVKIAETTSTSYADTGLPDDTSYTYRVSAVNTASVEGPKSDPVSARTDVPSPGFTESIMFLSFLTGLSIVLYRFRYKLRKQIRSN